MTYTPTQIYFENDQCTRYLISGHILHREDGPAMIRADGFTAWYLFDKLHRVGGPAVTNPDGSYEYFVHSERHREDGPAVINSSGTKEWWVNGLRHRLDGPAIEYPGGEYAWFKTGILHRTDGPAYYINGLTQYFINGYKYHDYLEYLVAAENYNTNTL